MDQCGSSSDIKHLFFSKPMKKKVQITLPAPIVCNAKMCLALNAIKTSTFKTSFYVVYKQNKIAFVPCVGTREFEYPPQIPVIAEI